MKRLFILICAIFVVASMSAQTRKVGQVIKVNGEFGVVIAVTSDGMHGKVMSVSQTKCDWANAKTWCSNYGSRWRLPSKDELLLIYRKKSVINSTLYSNGYTKLSSEWYWTSESSGNVCSVALLMGDGSSSTNILKRNKCCVRAVSAF